MQQNDDAVPRSDTPRAELLAVLLGAALAAGCGGPAAALHDVLDEAETRAELMLEIIEESNEDEMNEGSATELPPCPREYDPPALSEEPPPYMDVVDRPAVLDAGSIQMHRITCINATRDLRLIPRNWASLRPQLADFPDYADTLRSVINNDLEAGHIERLSAAVAAAAEADPDADDTLRLRYVQLNLGIVPLSPLVGEMFDARRPGARFDPGVIADLTVSENLENAREPWTTIIEAHAEAVAFFEAWNDYRRRIYEGPDAKDPDEDGANWGPLTGVWTGEYAAIDVLGNAGPREPVRITFEADGDVASHYPDADCGGTLDLRRTGRAFGRWTTYTENACGWTRAVTLERMADDRMRFSAMRRVTNWGGNLTRE